MNLLMKHDVSVAVENDIVVLSVDRFSMPMGYTTSLNIAQGLRVAAGHTFVVGGTSRSEVAELKRDAALDENVPSVIKDSQIRVDTTGRPWSIIVDGPLVSLVIGDHTFKMESDSALCLSGWLRREAKNAKQWSGDTGKTFRAFGILSDAEDNYKLGLS